jgi:hypothetical protein
MFQFLRPPLVAGALVELIPLCDTFMLEQQSLHQECCVSLAHAYKYQEKFYRLSFPTLSVFGSNIMTFSIRNTIASIEFARLKRHVWDYPGD